MATLTIELPETLVQQIETRGISQQRLERMFIHFIQIYFREYDAVSPKSTASSWPDGETFARQIIANNRELFDELARL